MISPAGWAARGSCQHVGDLDRGGGERAAWRTGPRGDVVGGRRRDPSDRGEPGRLARDLGRRRAARPACPRYWIENKGVNSLWHVPIPPQAVGARLHYRSVARARGSETVYQPVSGHDRPAQPARPHRVGRRPAARPRGPGRQPHDDGAGRSPRLDLRRLFPDRRPALRRPARRRGPAAEPLALPGDRRRPGRRAPARLVHRAALLGGVPALPGGDEPAGDRADLAERADPGPAHRLRRDGRLPAQDGGRDRVAGPVHQAVPDQERGRPSRGGPSSACTSRPRSTAASASPG